MARQTIVGIDIGTQITKVIVAEETSDQGHLVPKIIATGSSESRGVCRGYVNSVPEASKSLSQALSRAEKGSGTKIRRAYVSFGGVGLTSVLSSGTVAISRADMEISERDLALALEAAEAGIPASASINRKILNIVPIEYKIDGKIAFGEPLGLKAQKLEVRALFITCLEHHLADLISTVEEAGVEVIDVVAAPVAASFVTLTKKHKRVGSMLADLGSETLSTVVFENNNLVSLQVFPVGSSDITNDIALGLKISLEEAENVKSSSSHGVVYSKKKLDEIIAARLGDCFESIENHLKQIGRDALLPAGLILAGGGANILGIKKLAEHYLELPAQLAEIKLSPAASAKVSDLSWAVACGLVVVGLDSDNEQRSVGIRHGGMLGESSRRWARTLSRWFSQFIP